MHWIGGSFGSPPIVILRTVRGEKPIWLVGMMGSGKSTVGPALARRLGRPFVDTDLEIEAQAGLRIADIFARQGEAAFRALERAEIDRCEGTPVVAALGGGAIAQPGAAARLAARGTVVFLRAQPEVLLDRLGDASDRPLLAARTREARLARLTALLAEREPAYATARISVETGDASAEEVAQEIATRLAELEAPVVRAGGCP